MEFFQTLVIPETGLMLAIIRKLYGETLRAWDVRVLTVLMETIGSFVAIVLQATL